MLSFSERQTLKYWTERFGNGFSSSKKTNEEKIKNIFMFEKDNEDYNDE